MNVMVDALQVGPLVLAWDRLALLLAAGVWLGTAKFRHAPGTLLVTLLAARLTGTLPHWAELAPTVAGRAFSVLDLRSGTWFWPAGLTAGMVYLLLRSRGWPPALGRSLLLTATAVALPLLLRPAPPARLNADTVSLRQVGRDGEVKGVTFAQLPRPAVVNVWATWCGPCRAELPVLARAIQAGAPVVLVNAGEDPAQVRAFLDSVGVQATTFVDSGPLRQVWQVGGYPSTFVIDRAGQVSARHLGPLDAAQLRALVNRARER